MTKRNLLFLKLNPKTSSMINVSAEGILKNRGRHKHLFCVARDTQGSTEDGDTRNLAGAWGEWEAMLQKMKR